MNESVLTNLLSYIYVCIYKRSFFHDLLRIKDNYRANLNVEQSGAVVAAPDDATPGGSYYYHWMRDAGLSIKAWMDINDNDYNAVKDVLEPYLGTIMDCQVGICP